MTPDPGVTLDLIKISLILYLNIFSEGGVFPGYFFLNLHLIPGVRRF